MGRYHGSRTEGQCESAGSPTEPYSGDRGACPVGYAAVGTIWVASKPGGLNISEWLLSLALSGKATEGLHTKVRTGIGKTNLPGSHGGLWKRGDEGRRIEAHWETDGLATVP